MVALVIAFAIAFGIAAILSVLMLAGRAYVKDLERDVAASKSLIQSFRKSVNELNSERSDLLTKLRFAEAREQNARKLHSESTYRLTVVRMDAMGHLAHFYETLHALFGKDTGKPLDERLRDNFKAGGVTDKDLH